MVVAPILKLRRHVGFSDRRTRVVAAVLAAFTAATALAFHNDLADENQFFHFFRNIAMADGLPQVVAFEAYTVDAGAADWTVARLAAAAGMSRSSFAERFRARVGLATVDYLTRRRLHCVRRPLIDTELEFATIAARNGYRFRTSWIQSFKRIFGYSRYELRAGRSKVPPVQHGAEEICRIKSGF